MSAPTVAVTVVSFNSERYLRQCIESVFDQDYPIAQLVLIDNASSDASASILNEYAGRAQVVFNRVNTGFAAAQNQAIELTATDWVLVLNPDVRLTRNFVRELITAGEADAAIGTVCGKLLQMSPDLTAPEPPRIDSTGIFFTSNLRHLDRGSREIDRGQYDAPEYVFGATGAAALYRRKMIDDVAYGTEFFDRNFFAYREDADVSWRAQILGWTCLYTPYAVAYHVRSVLPSNRRSLPAVLNMHSVKNRFLLRIKNSTGALYRQHGVAMTIRDAAVIAACFVYEWASLRGLWLALRYLPDSVRKRRHSMRRKRVSDDYVVSWFSDHPVSRPATMPNAAVGDAGARV